MKLAIMQPYVFPYIGYFQLINEVDTFVFYEDVNFIKKGWINRNRILVNDSPHQFTIPCKGVSQNSLICDTQLAFSDKDKKKLLKTIESTYKKAPYFEEAFQLINGVIMKDYKLIHELAEESIMAFCRFISIRVNFKSSRDYMNNNLNKADRLIDICKIEKSDRYINAEGGKELYSKEVFAKEGIELLFLQTKDVSYKQFNEYYIPNLSIMDVMMFNDKSSIRNLLKQYILT